MAIWKPFLALSLVCTGLLGSPAMAQDTQADAAVRNYIDVLEGRIQYRELTPRERADVDEVARLVREKRLVVDLRTSEERCRDSEAKYTKGQPSDLAQRVIDMKCKEAF